MPFLLTVVPSFFWSTPSFFDLYSQDFFFNAMAGLARFQENVYAVIWII